MTKTDKAEPGKLDKLDTPIVPRHDRPVAIARVLRPVDSFARNVRGDRVSFDDPREAAWYAGKGYVAVEVASVRPSEIRLAGGVEAYLKANPKKDKVSPSVRNKLPEMPGLPTEKDRPPWELMPDVEG
jgi:hypothetical protein